MQTIRVGVVEDDATARQHIIDYLNRYQREQNVEFSVCAFSDGEEIVQQYKPVYDILLLDIEMKHMDGMEAARRIRQVDDDVVIVFITAAPQYAISGYKVRALSYLLKPVPWFAFSQEMKRCIGMVRRRSEDSLLVDAGSQKLRLSLNDVVYIESMRHTIIIHTLDGKLSISSTLKELEEQLSSQGFYRSNSCYLVNMRHVTGVDGQDCVMSSGERLRISRPRKKSFLIALADYFAGTATTGER